MGLSIKDIGKAIGKAAKDVGKVLKKAAPVLVPLIITAATGGFGGTIAGKMGTLGKVGQGLTKLLSGGAIKGGLLKGVDPGKLIADGIKKAAPTLITRAIEGKPKSAKAEAQSLYQNSPGFGVDPTAASAFAEIIKDGLKNPRLLSPATANGGYRTSEMRYGAPMSFASSSNEQNNLFDANAGASAMPVADDGLGQGNESRIRFGDPMAPISPFSTLTGGEIGALASPVAPETEDPYQKKSRGYAIRGRA